MFKKFNETDWSKFGDKMNRTDDFWKNLKTNFTDFDPNFFKNIPDLSEEDLEKTTSESSEQDSEKTSHETGEEGGDSDKSTLETSEEDVTDESSKEEL